MMKYRVSNLYFSNALYLERWGTVIGRGAGIEDRSEIALRSRVNFCGVCM